MSVPSPPAPQLPPLPGISGDGVGAQFPGLARCPQACGVAGRVSEEPRGRADTTPGSGPQPRTAEITSGVGGGWPQSPPRAHFCQASFRFVRTPSQNHFLGSSSEASVILHIRSGPVTALTKGPRVRLFRVRCGSLDRGSQAGASCSWWGPGGGAGVEGTRGWEGCSRSRWWWSASLQVGPGCVPGTQPDSLVGTSPQPCTHLVYGQGDGAWDARAGGDRVVTAGTSVCAH